MTPAANRTTGARVATSRAPTRTLRPTMRTWCPRAIVKSADEIEGIVK